MKHLLPNGCCGESFRGVVMANDRRGLHAASGALGCLLLAGAWQAAVAAESKDVMCGADKCGTMAIDKYEKYVSSPADGSGVGGVEIQGKFTPTKDRTYHYLQAITEDNSDAQRWFNDVSVPLPAPRLDTPPGGYKNQTFATGVYDINDAYDYLPWYDEPADNFPNFYDRPARLLERAKTVRGLSFQFETWLVCVIDETQGAQANKALDDVYKVAPLLGFTWGFTINYNDIGVIGTDELIDYTVTVTPFAWVNAQTVSWTNSLAAVYGAGASKDNFNITVGLCADCVAPVPEPAAQMLWLLGLMPLGVIVLRDRRRSGRASG